MERTSDGETPAGGPASRPAPPSGRSARLRWLVAAVVVLAVAAFFLLGGKEQLSWNALQARRDELTAYQEQHFLAALLLFVAVYLVVAALSLPGAAILTLTAGWLFGRGLGTAVVSVLSTTGATLAMLLTRYLFRDLVQARWGERLAAINRRVEKDGPFYLFTLRLVPAAPFFLINAAMGLTRMRVWTFWWVSQLGMLPGTFLYVNAGTELGRIRSEKDVLSAGLLASFALLGLVPLLFRLGLRWWLARRPEHSP